MVVRRVGGSYWSQGLGGRRVVKLKDRQAIIGVPYMFFAGFEICLLAGDTLFRSLFIKPTYAEAPPFRLV